MDKLHALQSNMHHSTF